MKISELIDTLKAYKKKYGDVEIYLTEIDSNGYNMIRNPHIYYLKEYKWVEIK